MTLISAELFVGDVLPLTITVEPNSLDRFELGTTYICKSAFVSVCIGYKTTGLTIIYI